MSTDVRVEVTIHRARTEVAEFMFEPKNDVIWTTGVVDVRPLTEGYASAKGRASSAHQSFWVERSATSKKSSKRMAAAGVPVFID